jgi:hypothetical protein
MPETLRRLLVALWYRTAVGAPEQFGLPKPDHRLGDAHPTVSDELLPLVRAGRISVTGPIARYDGNTVTFADGSRVEADAIVYATGYRVEFPFFEPEFVSAPNNELPLFHRIFHPERPGLYFIGLCQPLGPIFPIVEAQAELVAAHLAGDYALPPSDVVATRARGERETVRQRYGASPRHTMQVDFDDYLRTLAAERRAGAERARRGLTSDGARPTPRERQ